MNFFGQNTELNESNFCYINVRTRRQKVLQNISFESDFHNIYDPCFTSEEENDSVDLENSSEQQSEDESYEKEESEEFEEDESEQLSEDEEEELEENNLSSDENEDDLMQDDESLG